MARNFEPLPLYDKLFRKIHAYYETIWKDKWEEKIEEMWLSNFQDADVDLADKERINMLYLLSKFMYYGNKELRQLIFSLYRDLFKYPIISNIRKSNGDTLNIDLINNEFQQELAKTKFLGVGNPSESGVHLLYYFRQECNLAKDFFINASDVFKTDQKEEKLANGDIRQYLESDLRFKDINRYIFIDDFCGSGSQASIYLKPIVDNILFKKPDADIQYLMLFGTEFGLTQIRNLKIFSNVACVYSLDDTFKTFSDSSRYYDGTMDASLSKDFAKATVKKYEDKVNFTAFGYRDCQLLLGLFHNTPDNTLPVFWSEQKEWKPIFKRYQKKYS